MAHEFAGVTLIRLAERYDDKIIANNFVFIIEDLRKQLDREKDRLSEKIFRDILGSG